MMVMILALSLSYRWHSSGSHPSSAAAGDCVEYGFSLNNLAEASQICIGWELAANSYDEFHKIFLVFITLLGSILQTTYQPFETHYPKAVIFVVTIAIYFSSLLAELVLRINGRHHVIVSKLSLFSGVLAVILPILIIVPAIGWLALGIWVCVSGIVVYRFYDEIRDDFVEIVAEVRSVMNNLRDGNANGSRDERNGNANGSQDEPARLPV